MMRAGSWRPDPWRAVLVGLPALALVILFVAPTLIMGVATFQFPDDFGGLAPLWQHDAAGLQLNLTLENYERVAQDLIYARVFLKSLGYAAVVTVICAMLSYPIALAIATAPARYRDLLLLLVILPFWSNFLIRVYAWVMLLGPEGAVTRTINAVLALVGLDPVRLIYTPAAVLMGLVYVHLPFMILPLYANLRRHDPAWLDAARDLGARPITGFLRITLPMSVPGLLAGSVLVFIPALGAFAVPDILGGAKGSMIGNLISDQFLAARDWPFGSTLALLLTLAVVALAGLGAAAAARLPGGTRDA
jgi:spermidine/putrescine transport system permease protein